MKQTRWVSLLTASVMVISGCSWFGNNDSSSSEFTGTRIDNCQGNPTFIILDGECVPVGDILPENIQMNTDGTVEVYDQHIEMLDDFVADLSGSVGLAVVPEDYYNATKQAAKRSSDLAQWVDLDTTLDTQNVIVKLTEAGFFEEVDFQDASGAAVDITANPLALEIYGDYTLIVFETNSYSSGTEFAQQVSNSLYSGGVYVIHNPSGKMFATRNVTLSANTNTYTQDLSRNVTLNVTVGEPVVEIQMVPRLDEFGQPMYDINHQQIMDEVPFPLTDASGDPLIINEGPLVTEWVTEQKVEYFRVQRVDEDGNPVFDSVTGDPIEDIVAQPVVDQNGDPVMVSHEAVVLDNEGNPVRKTTFEMEFFIHEVKEITHTNYFTTLSDNALTPLAQKFVERLMSKYYNWYYAPSQNYVISNWGFAIGEGEIFFMQQVNNAQNQPENIVKKLGFDSITNELLIENYLNVTKAGLDGTEIILDPETRNIFSLTHTSSVNMKIYSPTKGLSALANTANYQAVTFPNGDLYFHTNMTNFVEELGYYTILLHHIDANGVITTKPIKLASYQMSANMENGDNLGVTLFDESGQAYTSTLDWIPLANEVGDPLLSTAELHIDTIDPFTSERQPATWTNASYDVRFHILDDLGNEIANFTQWIMPDEGDPVPPYDMWYQLDTSTIYNYQYAPTSNPRLCTNQEYGCVNHYNLMDPTVAEYGISMYQSRTIAYQDTYIQSINVHPDNNGVYNYSRLITSNTCEFTTCDEQIRYEFYNLAGELMQTQYGNYHALQGEQIPLVIKYQFSAATVFETEAEVCNSSSGCWRNYMTAEGNYYSLFYEAGDTVYSSITFAPTDRELVTSRTVESTVCTEPNGCMAPLRTHYTIRQPDQTILYEFEEQLWVSYGYRVPLDVTLIYDPEGDSDVDITYQLDYSSEQLYCTEANCEQYVQVQLPTLSDYNVQPYGYVELDFTQGEALWSSIVIPQATLPTQTNTTLRCNDPNGCKFYTGSYDIVDALGQPVAINSGYRPQLAIPFETGDLLPIGEFHVTFQMENVVYETNQLSPHAVLNNWGTSIVLDENTYLFPPTSPNWQMTPYVNNIVLSYDPMLDEYSVGYTNLEGFFEIVHAGDAYYTINDEKTGIYKYELDESLSHDGFYYFAETYLTEGLAINAANELIVDFDGTIYFRGVDNFIQDMTGVISVDGVVTIDTVYTEHEIIRLTPVN